jgi:Cu(I)/Ag(I) efflux system membrane fusion protein
MVRFLLTSDAEVQASFPGVAWCSVSWGPQKRTSGSEFMPLVRMRSFSITLRALLLPGLAAALLVSAACSRKPEPTAEEPGAQPSAPESAGGREAMAEGEVMIDPRRQQLTGVTFATVERRDVDQEIRTVGNVTYDESRLSDVTLKFEGWIEELFVDKTGELVRKNDRLFTLYSPALVSTQEDYLVALDNYRRLEGSGDERAIEGAKDFLAAAHRRLDYWDIEDKHVRELEEDRRVLRTLPIHAPASGYVIDKDVVAGAHVPAGKRLYRLADLDEVWVLADVYEYELPLVHVGQPAEVSLPYIPDRRFHGRVGYIYPYLEAQERTVKVRIQLPNPDHVLKAEMYADVVLRARHKAVLLVPQSAVIDSGKRQVVFLDKGEGRFEPREVRLGATLEGSYEVLSGLEEGDRIVASGNFLLDSESQLSAGMRQMTH